MSQTHEDPRRARTRAKVLAAGRDLLQEGGIAAVTIDGVAARSGVAKTTIYRQWPGRSDLVVALFSDLVPVLPPPDPAASLREQLVALLTSHGRQLEDGPWAAALPALIAAADRDGELDGIRREVLLGARRSFADLIEDHAGELGAVDLHVAAAQLFGPLLHRRLIDARPIDAALVDEVADAFLAHHRSDRRE